MLKTIDGNATGIFWRTTDVWEGVKHNYKLFDHLKPQAYTLGRVIIQEFSDGKQNLSKYKNKEKLKHEDFVVPLEKGAK